LRRRLGWIALGLVLFWMVGYPLLLTLVESLGAPGWTLANYAEFVRRPAEWHALWASLWISVATVVLSAAVGVPMPKERRAVPAWASANRQALWESFYGSTRPPR